MGGIVSLGIVRRSSGFAMRMVESSEWVDSNRENMRYFGSLVIQKMIGVMRLATAEAFREM